MPERKRKSHAKTSRLFVWGDAKELSNTIHGDLDSATDEAKQYTEEFEKDNIVYALVPVRRTSPVAKPTVTVTNLEKIP